MWKFSTAFDVSLPQSIPPLFHGVRTRSARGVRTVARNPEKARPMNDSYDEFPHPTSARADTSLPDPTLEPIEPGRCSRTGRCRRTRRRRRGRRGRVRRVGSAARTAEGTRRPRLRRAHADPARDDPSADRRPRSARSGRHGHRQDGGVRPPGTAAHRHEPSRRTVGARPGADPRTRRAGERGDVQVRQGTRHQGGPGVRRPADPAPAAAARPWRPRRRGHAGPRHRPHRARLARSSTGSAR